MEKKRDSPKIYWANSMFSVADREFNARYARVLRQAGYEVYLPQESAVNEETAPSAGDIFRIDTAEIVDSDILVACIDQETIDSGVACEIGIAFAFGVPVVGLYTDIRQYRQGPSRMYKNPYVVGAIEALGTIVSSVDELLQAIPKYLSTRPRSLERDTIRHFDVVASRYSEFVKLLEIWYEPAWSVVQVFTPWIQRTRATRLVEFGCGTGDLAALVLQQYPDLVYVGYDLSTEMIRVANSRNHLPSCTFTTSWQWVEEEARKRPFDIALASFALHDHPHPHRVIEKLARILRIGGLLFIIDLSTWDLPNLTNLLRKKLARPATFPDTRLDPLRLNTWAREFGLTIVECGLETPLVRFPDKEAIIQYFTIFGIYEGMDLPLALDMMSPPVVSRLIAEILETLEYPFVDQRVFLRCILQKG